MFGRGGRSGIGVPPQTSGYTGGMRPRNSNRALAYTVAGLAMLTTAMVFGAGEGSPAGAKIKAAVSGLFAANGGPAAAEPTTAPAAQYGRRRRTPPRYPDPRAPADGDFVFARVEYEKVRDEFLGQGWYTDYPTGDRNFMTRFDEFTAAQVSRTDSGYPNHVVVELFDEELFKYPFIFMSDVGTVRFDSIEVERLREYLLKGGFLWADDFWGWLAWDYWSHEIGRVLPPDEYPIFDIPPEHPIRQMLYDIAEIPQIPSIQWWRNWGRYTTSERGAESAIPHLRGISDKDGRLLVLMSHDTDIADGWERENDDFEFFDKFSFPAYAVGINVGVYVMSH